MSTDDDLAKIQADEAQLAADTAQLAQDMTPSVDPWANWCGHRWVGMTV